MQAQRQAWAIKPVAARTVGSKAQYPNYVLELAATERRTLYPAAAGVDARLEGYPARSRV